MESSYFTKFKICLDAFSLPKHLNNPFDYEPHPLCLVAVEEVQKHLSNQKEWEHNFGLVQGKKGKIIGKMFGVLVVQNKDKELGYLAAFSGKLAGGNHHKHFVPPVFDMLTKGSFLNRGMEELGLINSEIKRLSVEEKDHKETIQALKEKRKNHSIALQEKLFDQYHFLNQLGKEKSLRDIFKHTLHKNPPSGAGECAAPKLLQYAFQHQMKPLAIAEFWWGLSPKSDFWKHKHFYPACQGKCGPILKHMLEGLLNSEQGIANKDL